MKILLCVDDDPQYDVVLRSLEWCLSVASEDDVLVAHAVATLRWLPLKAGESGWAGAEREILQRVDDFLADAVDATSRNGVRAEPLRLEGDVAFELLKAADEHGVDVVVTGAIGDERSRAFLVGSVAEKLQSLAERDLLMLRARGPESSGRFRVLIAVDDTEGSFRAVEAFIKKCRATRAEIYIVHVVPGSDPETESEPGDGSEASPPTGEQERTDRAVLRAGELFRSQGLEVTTSVRHGEAAREILSAAKRCGADLIVVGHGDRKNQARIAGWRGTVTDRVARHAPCSVFVGASVPLRRPNNARGDNERKSS